MEYELGELLPYEQPADYIVESTDCDDSYKTPVLTAGKSFIIGYTNETKGIYTKLPVIIFDDFTTSSQYVDFPFKVKSSAMKILSVNSEIADLKYLFYKMQTIQFDSANHKRYWISEYSKIKLDLPTLAEQQRIVNRIETMFAKLDQAQEKAQTVLDSFETRKAAILHKAFNGELTANWRKENGVADDSWEEKTIGDICTVVRGGSPRPAGDSKYYDGSIPFMKVADITRNDSKYVYSTEYTIKEAGLHKTRMVEPNTLLLTNSGATLGVPATTMIKTTFNDGIAAFLDLPEESNLYFYYFWTSKTIELRTINMGAAQPNLNIDIISNIIAPVPTLPEQQEIVRILDSMLEKESRAKEAAQTVLDKIALLKKSILARAFRGEL